MASFHDGDSQAVPTAADSSTATPLVEALASMSLSSAEGLQNKQQRKLLDAIDALRAQHIEGIDPVQLVVCGGQSTGKSSVLEAISGIPFPRGETLCTRFASEIVLRRDPDPSIYVSIRPGTQRSAEEVKKLEGFSRRIESWDAFPELIEEATQLMGLGSSNTRSRTSFARDVLHIESSGPEQPHLTLVDLPGIIHTTTDGQNPEDPQLVRELVWSYMQKPSSIILAVVTASTDFGNQAVFDFVRELDNQGTRTLGIITKLDRVRAGSADERSWLHLAQNKTKKLQLGWHVVKNVDTSEQRGRISPEERDRQESEFFRKSPFHPDPNIRLGVGIPQLRERLSDILLESIQDSLEPLQERIDSKMKEVRGQLDILGKERSTPDKQKQHLLDISKTYYKICDEALNGTYLDQKFFGVDNHKDRYLCAKLKKLHEDFSTDLIQNGQKWELAREISLEDGRSDVTVLGRAIPWSKWIDHVCGVMKDMRGHLLPNSIDNQIIKALFVDLSKPWEGIASAHLRRVRATIKTFVKDLLASLTDDYSKISIQKFWLEKELDAIFDKCKAEMDKLVAALQLPLMTSRQGYIDRLEKFEASSWLSDAAASGEDSEDVHSAEDADLNLSVIQFQAKCHIEQLLAYYLTVRETFIDNIPTLAIWSQIITGLPEAFSPSAIGRMTVDEIEKLARESKQNVTRRNKLLEDFEVLERGYNECEDQLIEKKLMRPTSYTQDLDSNDSTSSSSSSSTVAPTIVARAESSGSSSHNIRAPATPSQRPPHIVHTASTPQFGWTSASPVSSQAASIESTPSMAASVGTAATSPSPHPSAKGYRRQGRSSVWGANGGVNPLQPSPARLFDSAPRQQGRGFGSNPDPFAAKGWNPSAHTVTVQSYPEEEL